MSLCGNCRGENKFDTDTLWGHDGWDDFGLHPTPVHVFNSVHHETTNQFTKRQNFPFHCGRIHVSLEYLIISQLDQIDAFERKLTIQSVHYWWTGNAVACHEKLRFRIASPFFQAISFNFKFNLFWSLWERIWWLNFPKAPHIPEGNFSGIGFIENWMLDEARLKWLKWFNQPDVTVDKAHNS